MWFKVLLNFNETCKTLKRQFEQLAKHVQKF